MTKKWLLCAAMLVALAAGCDTSTQPQELETGGFIADLQDTYGSSIYFNSTSALAASDYTMDITDGSNSEFFLDGLQTGLPLPYTVTPSQGAKVQFFDARTGLNYYSTYGSCSITITQTAPTLEGTFSARLVSPASIDSLRIVTYGQFNASIQ